MSRETTALLSTTHRIARIAGPAALVIAITEARNMHIFAAQTAPVVYLNGTLLFIGGIAILQAHHRWSSPIASLVTLVGWGAACLGLIRMAAPDAPQLGDGPVTGAVLLALALVGALLTAAGYRPEARRSSASLSAEGLNATVSRPSASQQAVWSDSRPFGALDAEQSPVIEDTKGGQSAG